MLIRLFGRNFRSLRDNFELSLVAADSDEKTDINRGVLETHLSGLDAPLRLLRTIAIFGPNASGKSTVLTAALALRWLCVDSSYQAKPESKIPPFEPFALDEHSSSAAIELGCDVTYKQSLLRYEVKFTEGRIVREQMSLHGEKPIQLIDRHASGEVRGRLFSKNNANQLYVKGMQPNVTVLSKLAQHGPRTGGGSVLPYFKAIRSALRHKNYSGSTEPYASYFGQNVEKFASDPEYREWVMQHLIRAADVGICDVELNNEEYELPDMLKAYLEKSITGIKVPTTRHAVSFMHEGAKRKTIDFTDESAGTKKLFNLASDWWQLAKNPVTLFADELSASLHPRLLDRIVRAVNDVANSTVKSQLIFATHDAGLLEGHDGRPPALRHDQVYFTSKAADGATKLYSLAEIKENASESINIRKRYLSGLYGALPSIERISL